MIVKQVPVVDAIVTNVYFYIDEKTKHGFIIDAAAEANRLLDIIKTNGWTIEKILLTHGHFDHIGAVEEISEALSIPYYIHENGKQYLMDPDFNVSSMFGNDICLDNAQYLKDGDELVLAANPQVKLKVYHTPGHTLDSSVYADEENKVAFVGDTIFKDSVGRTDLPGGSMQQLRQSIHKILTSFAEDMILYSGHTEPTTVKAEKKWHSV